MHRVRIVNGDALRSVLDRVYEEYGTHRKSAEFLGIGQTTFTRLLNGTVHKAMSFDTYASIREALEGHAAEFGLIWQFEGSVLTADGWLVKQQYEDWLDKEIKRLEPKTAPVIRQLWEHEEYRSLFQRFLERVTGRPELQPKKYPEEKRIRLALYRSVEPFGDGRVTWGVERTWEEIHRFGDLASYLRAALRREEIVLDRKPDLERIRKRRAPEEYKAWLAEDVEPSPEEIAQERAQVWDPLRKKTEKQKAERARNPEIFDFVLVDHRSTEHRCETCGFRATYHLCGGTYVWLCPNCAADRIARVRQRRDVLPDSIAELEREVLKEVNLQKGESRSRRRGSKG